MTRIAALVSFVGAVTLLLMFNSGKIQQLSEESGRIRAALDSAVQTIREAEEEKARQRELLETERAIRADTEKRAAQAQARADRLSKDMQRLQRENEEFRRWIDAVHPDDVRLFINSARSGDTDKIRDESTAARPD